MSNDRILRLSISHTAHDARARKLVQRRAGYSWKHGRPREHGPTASPLFKTDSAVALAELRTVAAGIEGRPCVCGYVECACPAPADVPTATDAEVERNQARERVGSPGEATHASKADAAELAYLIDGLCARGANVEARAGGFYSVDGLAYLGVPGLRAALERSMGR